MRVNFPNITDYKILLTVSELNDRGYYPLVEGVLKILSGIIDDETEEFKGLPTFQSLLSFNSKQLSRNVNMLLRYQYLKKIYDEKSDELYLKITDKGQAFLLDFKKHHHINLKKHTKKVKKTIVKL